MAASLSVKLVQTGAAKFAATSPSGASLVIDGPADMGGENAGMRPMEVQLAALAGCSALDVVSIMKKQRQPLERLEIEVNGDRADAVPAVYTRIHLRFVGHGPIELEKLQRAVALSMEKYCSVTKMLEPTVTITAEGVLGSSGGVQPSV